MVVVDIPHVYDIKDVHEPYGVVRFGPEIKVNPPYRPEKLRGTQRFWADKEGHDMLVSRSYSHIKTLIDREEDK